MPLRMWPISVGTDDRYMSICPPIKSLEAWAAPLYGMWVSLMPAAFCNCTAARCATVPLPELA
ncbi:hypothetical protein D3C77_564100 [compost metagenome]